MAKYQQKIVVTLFALKPQIWTDEKTRYFLNSDWFNGLSNSSIEISTKKKKKPLLENSSYIGDQWINIDIMCLL